MHVRELWREKDSTRHWWLWRWKKETMSWGKQQPLLEVSNLFASLGNTGTRVVLGHTLTTLWHVITKNPHNVLSKFMTLCGLHSWPSWAACGPWAIGYIPLLDAGNHWQFIASKKTWTLVYNFKELNFCQSTQMNKKWILPYNPPQKTQPARILILAWWDHGKLQTYKTM